MSESLDHIAPPPDISSSPEYLEQNPYPGLNSYEEDREEFFNGRDKERQTILDILNRYSLCFLIGKSGIGKSSLINAGLIPEFRKRDFVPIAIRINFDSKVNLTEQVRRRIESVIHLVDEDALTFKKGMLLWEYFQELQIFGGYLKSVLIFDQFEEIFTRGNERQKELNSLLKELIDLAENSVPDKVQRELALSKKTIPSNIRKDYQIIFSLREDYLPQLTGLRIHIPTLRYSVVRLEQIPALEAYKAVFLPAQKAQLLDEETAKSIVAKVPESRSSEFDLSITEGGDSAGDPADDGEKAKKVEPFLLNLLCYKLNEERKARGEKTISKEAVAGKNLQTLVKEYYLDTTRPKAGLSIAIEEELLTTNGKFRKNSEKGVFIKTGKLNDQDVDYLIDHKLIRRKRMDGLEYVELIHDILIPIVAGIREKRSRRKIVLRTLAIVGTILAILGIASWIVLSRQVEVLQNEKIRLEGEQNRIAYMRRVDSLQNASARASLAEEARVLLLLKQGDSLRSKQERLRALAEEEKIRAEKIFVTLAKEQQGISRARDSLRNQSALDSFNRLKRSQFFTDSVLGDVAAVKLSQKSQAEYYKPARKTLARLAFDTLVRTNGGKITDLFSPDVYYALVISMMDTFRQAPYYDRNSKKDYRNIDDLAPVGGGYFITRPFISVVDGLGREIMEDTTLVHSWANSDGSLLAFVSLTNGKPYMKKLKIKDVKANKIVNEWALSVDQDVFSLVFDPGNTTCVFSTSAPGGLYKWKIRSAQDKPVSTGSVSRESIYLVNRPGSGLIGVTVSGKYYRWDDHQLQKGGVVMNLQNEGPVTAVCNSGSEAGGVFVGNENGEVYAVGLSGLPKLIFSEERIKITRLSCTKDNKWLAVGYARGGLSLKRLDLKDRAPVRILPSFVTYATDAITGLFFTPDNATLVAVSAYGYVYNFPVSMNVIATMICEEGKYLKPQDPRWNTYMSFSGKNLNVCD